MTRHNKINIGDWDVSLTTCTLQRGDEQIKITPRSMDVLAHLALHAGEVVSHEELLERFWHGTFTSDHAVHKVIAELRAALGDDAHRPLYIKTIPKRGYSVIADVRLEPSAPPTPVEANVEARVAPDTSTATIIPFWRLDRRLLAGGVLGVVLASALLWPSQQVDGDKDEVARLAVMPFENRALNGDNQFLTDGLREGLIHGLSKLSHLEVLSPGKAPEGGSERDFLRARTLRADHFLQGSVQVAENRLRVSVRLVRTDDGVNQYTDQFDLPATDLFGIQDEIVSNIVSALRVHLDESERSQMLDWGTTDALAYEHFLRGEFHYNRFSPADFQLSIDHYLKAIEQDPEFVNAYVGAATAANNLAVYGNTHRIAELSRFVDDIHREISRLAPQSPVLASINEMRLRMSGSSQVQQEIQLREQILSGSPPEFAMSHYALFLIGARLFDEASQFLDRVTEAGPYEISPDEAWSYRNSVAPPDAMLLNAKLELQQRPDHVGYLGTAATSLALAGDYAQAELYLKRQQEADIDGIRAHFTAIVIGFLRGDIHLGNEAYQAAMAVGDDFNFNKGALSFMLGDIDTGIKLWRQLTPPQKRQLFNATYGAEKYFPTEILEDKRYQDLLEELDFGISWQRRLMEGVMAMEEKTGVKLNELSRQAYDNHTFLSRNNLWSAEQWSDLEARKLQRMQATLQ